MLVALGVAALDRRDVDRGFDRRKVRVLTDDQTALADGEAAAHLGHHQVSRGERHVGVRRVECVRAGVGDVPDIGLDVGTGHGGLLA